MLIIVAIIAVFVFSVSERVGSGTNLEGLDGGTKLIELLKVDWNYVRTYNRGGCSVKWIGY